MKRLLLWWARWRLEAAREALTTALPHARPDFVAHVTEHMNHLEHDIAVLST